MSWTYSGDPSASSLDEVRFLIGDTDTTDQLLQDAEVTYAITKYTDPLQAAVSLCVQLAAKFARLVDVADDTVKAAFSQRSKGFASLADTLKQQLMTPLVGPWAGSFSLDYQKQVASDVSMVQPQFTIGMTDDADLEPGPLLDALLSEELP